MRESLSAHPNPRKAELSVSFRFQGHSPPTLMMVHDVHLLESLACKHVEVNTWARNDIWSWYETNSGINASPGLAAADLELAYGVVTRPACGRRTIS